MANWGMLLFTNGIIPAFLRHFIITPSYYCNLSPLCVIPIEEESPFILNVSLIEIGIPNKGGK
jgi:hypothetical protein